MAVSPVNLLAQRAQRQAGSVSVVGVFVYEVPNRLHCKCDEQLCQRQASCGLLLPLYRTSSAFGEANYCVRWQACDHFLYGLPRQTGQDANVASGCFPAASCAARVATLSARCALLWSLPAVSS